jgi:hypothetical protein
MQEVVPCEVQGRSRRQPAKRASLSLLSFKSKGKGKCIHAYIHIHIYRKQPTCETRKCDLHSQKNAKKSGAFRPVLRLRAKMQGRCGAHTLTARAFSHQLSRRRLP